MCRKPCGKSELFQRRNRTKAHWSILRVSSRFAHDFLISNSQPEYLFCARRLHGHGDHRVTVSMPRIGSISFGHPRSRCRGCDVVFLWGNDALAHAMSRKPNLVGKRLAATLLMLA
jgi:hypothetical protein